MPGVAAEHLEVAEHVEEADAPRDRRERQVVALIRSVMKPRNSASSRREREADGRA